MQTLKIRDYEIVNGDHVLVTASVHHSRGESVDAKQAMVQMHNETQGKLSAVAGSFVVLNDEPVRKVIQGMMALSHAALPVTDNMEELGFRSLSKNMFLDDQERIWNVEETESGRIAVRSNTVDNPEELAGLLAQCSVPISKGSDPQYFSALASSSSTVANHPKSGDYVSFVDAGRTQFGFVISPEFESDSSASYTGNLSVLASDAEKPVTISDKQVVGNMGFVDYPEPEQEASAAVGNVGKTQVQQLVDYYRRVYSYAPKYFAELQKRIRQHVFA